MQPVAPLPATAPETRVAGPSLASLARGTPRPAPVIRCRPCGHTVTSPEQRVTRDGAHVHTRINPGGWVHELGCFASAPGARAEGTPTLEHTWFAGYAWRFAMCGGCGHHLGWQYEGPSPFWGLILVELEGA